MASHTSHKALTLNCPTASQHLYMVTKLPTYDSLWGRSHEDYSMPGFSAHSKLLFGRDFASKDPQILNRQELCLKVAPQPVIVFIL